LERLAEHLTALEVNWADEFTDLRTLSVATQQRLLDGALPAYRADVGLGSKGAQALRVQRRLNALGYLLHRMVDGRFGKSSVAALKAFQQANGLKDDGKAGALTQNLLFGPDAVENKTPWRLRVSLEDQKTYAYRLGEDGEYRLERTMICSTGLLDEWTPRGVFLKTGQQEKWHYFSKYYVWGRYTYYIDGDIMFHSVLFSSRDEASVNPTSVALLGRRASHGCVRLSVEDAKWLYETCPKGTIVIVE
ncbi:MAG: L,D-transpeptidase family protein, partial [Eubacteriales bacterium]|nr:L,D-transpeptidase family protein [Eubacteriales bacterium]